MNNEQYHHLLVLISATSTTEEGIKILRDIYNKGFKSGIQWANNNKREDA